MLCGISYWIHCSVEVLKQNNFSVGGFKDSDATDTKHTLWLEGSTLQCHACITVGLQMTEGFHKNV